MWWLGFRRIASCYAHEGSMSTRRSASSAITGTWMGRPGCVRIKASTTGRPQFHDNRVAHRARLVLLAVGRALRSPRRGSAWVQGLHSRVRLICRAAPRASDRLAGVEIVLDGFQDLLAPARRIGPAARASTGAAPPMSGEVESCWPAPKRLEDAGGRLLRATATGSCCRCRCRPRDPGRPAVAAARPRIRRVQGDLHPGPRRARASIFPAAVTSPTGRRHRASAGLARVPRPAPFGAPGPACRRRRRPRAGRSDKPALARDGPRAPADATLFAEGPEDWFVVDLAAAGRRRLHGHDRRRGRRTPDGPVALLRLTLVAGDRAIETELHLDEDADATLSCARGRVGRREDPESDCTMTIQVGDRLPQATFRVMTAGRAGGEDHGRRVQGTQGGAVAVPGAFTPTCHRNHLPGYVEKAEAIQARASTRSPSPPSTTSS